MTFFDHVVVFIFAVAYPAYALFTVSKVKGRISAGSARARAQEYRATILVLCALALLAGSAWVYSGRPAADLGLAQPTGWRFWSSLVVVAVAVAGVVHQGREVMRSCAARAQVRRQMNRFGELLPHTRSEFALFVVLAVTAGVCEEILYRGFLIWYASQFAGTVVAVGIAALVFGFGHAYQGWRGAAQTFMLGVAFALLYLFTQSLWIPMACHIAIDVNGGILSYAAFTRDDISAPAGRLAVAGSVVGGVTGAMANAPDRDPGAPAQAGEWRDRGREGGVSENGGDGDGTDMGAGGSM